MAVIIGDDSHGYLEAKISSEGIHRPIIAPLFSFLFKEHEYRLTSPHMDTRIKSKDCFIKQRPNGVIYSYDNGKSYITYVSNNYKLEKISQKH